MPEFIYHITSPEQWQIAQGKGAYQPDAYDVEGFIHCCDASQIRGVVSRYFQGQDNLLILKIKTALLCFDVRYESLSEGLDAFPHLYGTLNLEAVDETCCFSANRMEALKLGEFIFS